jgi:hypothetical protein
MEQSVLQDALIKVLPTSGTLNDSELTRAEKMALSLINVVTSTDTNDINRISAFQAIDCTLARIFDR